MNKLTKAGLTALAGSLVASSAYAGALDVSGSAKMTYFANDEDETTGNSFKMGKGITFSGSGELDNGFTMNYSYTMTNAAFSSQTISVDMGDAGTVGISNSGAAGGLIAYQSVIPNSGEQVWDDMNNNDNGITSWNNLSDTNSLFYKNSFGGFSVNLAYTDEGNTGASDEHGVVTYDMGGITIGVGGGEEGSTKDMETYFVKYSMGNITAAYQRTNLDFTAAATADEESDSIGIGVAVNEDLSISLGRTEVDLGAGNNDEESTGVSVSYTMGSMSITAISNSQDNTGGSASADDAYKELSVAFAF